MQIDEIEIHNTDKIVSRGTNKMHVDWNNLPYDMWGAIEALIL